MHLLLKKSSWITQNSIENLKRQKEVHNFFCKLNLRFFNKKGVRQKCLFLWWCLCNTEHNTKVFIWVKIVSNIVSKKKKLASLKSANVICLPSTMNRRSVFSTLGCTFLLIFYSKFKIVTDIFDSTQLISRKICLSENFLEKLETSRSCTT